MTEKFIYYANRNPELKGRFRSRWRRHAALASTLPPVWDHNVKLYAQYDPVIEPPAALGVTAKYDGVGMVWLLGGDAYETGMASEAMEIMQRDEAETFSALVHNTAFICSETVLKPGEGLYKVFSAVDRADSGTLEDFGAVLINGFARDLIGHPALGPRLAAMAVCQRNALSDGGGRTHDALIEYAFHTLDDATAFFGSDAYAAVAAEYERKVSEVERVATRIGLLEDLQLYD